VQLQYISIQCCIYYVVVSLVCFKRKYHRRGLTFNNTDTNATKTNRTP